MTKAGDHYWVFAHVTPSFDANRKVCGFHSNRRVPRRDALEKIIVPLYADLARIEAGHRNGKEAVSASLAHLMNTVTAKKPSYDEFIFSL